MKRIICLYINDDEVDVAVEPSTLLLDVLRNALGLTGTRRGCESSYCGACSVLIDGRVAHSCTILAVLLGNRKVTTVEGLVRDGKFDPLQQAFIDQNGFQCGYCTPGMILAGKALLLENPKPTEEDVRRAIDGNLCRCTGYQKIVRSILAAAPEDGTKP
ncbi:MAG TPA: (2Fe-2S)-binding protein [Candidatus Binatia bacterium]|jgi:aerobic-type carbon monoxide dehydrogenase small subunit (CoxS/CutS family)